MTRIIIIIIIFINVVLKLVINRLLIAHFLQWLCRFVKWQNIKIPHGYFGRMKGSGTQWYGYRYLAAAFTGTSYLVQRMASLQKSLISRLFRPGAQQRIQQLCQLIQDLVSIVLSSAVLQPRPDVSDSIFWVFLKPASSSKWDQLSFWAKMDVHTMG